MVENKTTKGQANSKGVINKEGPQEVSKCFENFLLSLHLPDGQSCFYTYSQYTFKLALN